MATRITQKDLDYRIAEFNERFCADGSNYQLVGVYLYGDYGIGLAVYNESGKLSHLTGSIGDIGAPRVVIAQAEEIYYNNCDSSHTTQITRKTAKGILAANGVDFSKEACQLPHSALDMLSKWAKLTKYRKSATSSQSTGSAFFEHLKKKVTI